MYLWEDGTVLSVCSLYQIRREETVPGESDQMGVAEAANRRAADGVRSMLYAANLPAEFWGPAVVHWCDVDWFTVNTIETCTTKISATQAAPDQCSPEDICFAPP